MTASLARSPDDQLDQVFRALGDPTRREMLRILAGGQRSVTELSEPFAISLAGVSKHVKVLESAGLVSQTADGRKRICRLEPSALATVDSWLTYYRTFWTASLDALAEQLRKPDRSADGVAR